MIKTATLLIKGSYYYGVDKLDKSFVAVGKEVLLLQEPENEYDNFAVLVKTLPEEIVLGHISKDLSKKYFGLIGDELILSAKIKRYGIHQGGAKKIYIDVEYVDTGEFTKALNDIGLSALENTPGVYAIKRQENDTAYIGSSVNLRARLRKHFRELLSGSHTNKLIQNDFDAFGIGKFKISVLWDDIDKEDIENFESYEIERYLSRGERLYNKTIDGIGVPGAANNGASISDKIRPEQEKIPDKEAEENQGLNISSGNYFPPQQINSILLKMSQQKASALDRIRKSDTYSKACAGNVEAQRQIGIDFFAERLPSEALEWFIKASENGDLDAMADAAYTYYRGWHDVVRNVKEAYRFWSKAASMGHKGACLNLSRLYRDGEGVDKDQRLSDYWLEKSLPIDKPDPPRVYLNEPNRDKIDSKRYSYKCLKCLNDFESDAKFCPSCWTDEFVVDR